MVEGVEHQRGEGEEGVQHNTWDNSAGSFVPKTAALAVYKPLTATAEAEVPGAVVAEVAAVQGWVASQDRRHHH